MPKPSVDRRKFLRDLAGSAAALSILPHAAEAQPARTGPPLLRFAVIGINHGHINSQVNAVLRGGGELVSVFAKEPELLAGFTKTFPQAKAARSENEILEDRSIHLVLSAGIPVERGPLGVRVMQHGKDYMADKPGITTLGQLAEIRKVQAETKRIYSIMYSERFENRATVKAGELVKAGAIGQVIQTIGLGPHRITPASRPEWFWHKEQFGGILCDIASHQADQFLYFTGSTSGEVVSSQVANVRHADKPGFEDFGDATLRGNRGTGYIRVDWFTPDGLSTWGDGRLTILGTDGFIEIRKNVDIGGRPGPSHLFLVDKKETRYIETKDVELPYGAALVQDVVNRTDTAMTQAHCFLATELMLKAQAQATRVTFTS
ncbi:MAG: Gfo/Idh/MocA family oxidoreductase [Vicinamibacterales bacterium]